MNIILMITMSLTLALILLARYIAKSKNLNKKKTFMLNLGMVVCVIIMNLIIRSPIIKSKINSIGKSENIASSQNHERMMTRLKIIVDDPKFQAKLNSMNPKPHPFALARTLVNKGLKRLELDDLLRWNKLRLLMANLNSDYCQALVTKKIDNDKYLTVMSNLSDKELDDWFEIEHKAIILEIQGKEGPIVNQFDFNLAFANLLKLKLLSESEKSELKLYTNYSNQRTEDKSCWFIKTLMRNVRSLKNENKIRLLRFLTVN